MKKLKCGPLNIRSLSSKGVFINELILDNDIDLLAVPRCIYKSFLLFFLDELQRFPLSQCYMTRPHCDDAFNDSSVGFGQGLTSDSSFIQ